MVNSSIQSDISLMPDTKQVQPTASSATIPLGNNLPKSKLPQHGPTSSLSTSPTCQNCQTSTTPLWRRDELGQILCNACGLFLKLHGQARPISLKRDTIKSRNRNKNKNKANNTSDNSNNNPLPTAASTTVDLPSTSPLQTPESPSTSPQNSNQQSPASQRKKKTKTKLAIPKSTLSKSSQEPLKSPQNPVGDNSTLPLKSVTDAQATILSSTSSSSSSSSKSSPKEQLPSLFSLDPTSNPATTHLAQQSPYSTWSGSPSFNPLPRGNHLSFFNSPAASPLFSSTTANSLAPLTSSTKNIENSPRPPLPPPTSLNRTHSPAPSHPPVSLQAITSPLLLASTPSSHLYPSPLRSQNQAYFSHTIHSQHQQSCKEGVVLPKITSEASAKPIYPSAITSTATALDQLTSAASKSPYLSPVPQQSDTRQSLPVEKTRSILAESNLDSSSSTSHETASDSTKNSDNQNLQTRVSELELVNYLLRSRISELESAQEVARKSEAFVRESEIILRVRVNKLENKNMSFMKRIKTLRKVLLSSDNSATDTSGNNSYRFSVPRDALADLLDYDDDQDTVSDNEQELRTVLHPKGDGGSGQKLSSLQNGGIPNGKRVVSCPDPSTKRLKVQS